MGLQEGMVADGYLRFVVEYDAQGAPYVQAQLPASDNGKAGSARQDRRGEDDGQDTKKDEAHNNPGRREVAATPGHAQDGQVDEDVQLHKENGATGANDSIRKANSKKRKLDDGEEGREKRSEQEWEKMQKRERASEGAAVQRSESTCHPAGEGGEGGMDHQMADSTMAEGRKDDTKKRKKKKEKKKKQEPEATAETNDPQVNEEVSEQSVAALEEEIRRLKEQIAGIGCEDVSGGGEGLDEQRDHVVTSEQHQKAKKKKKKKKAEDGAEYVPRLSASEREALVAEALSQVALLRASD